jgi:hypothetical protein
MDGMRARRRVREHVLDLLPLALALAAVGLILAHWG